MVIFLNGKIVNLKVEVKNDLIVLIAIFLYAASL